MGFKDTLTCLTYDYWKAVLPPHSVILVYRDPREVAGHYLWRADLRNVPFVAFAALRCWAVYNARILSTLECWNDVLILNYAMLMKDGSELGRLTRFVGCRVPDGREVARYRARNIHGALYEAVSALVRLSSEYDVKAIHQELNDRLQHQHQFRTG